MAPRTCLCGEKIEFSEEYGPASSNLMKWYENGKSFGSPATRRKFYLCRHHTNEMVEYLDAIARGGDYVMAVRSDGIH